MESHTLYCKADISDNLRKHRYYRRAVVFFKEMDEAHLRLLDKGFVKDIPAGSSDRGVLGRYEAVAEYYEEKREKEKKKNGTGAKKRARFSAAAARSCFQTRACGGSIVKKVNEQEVCTDADRKNSGKKQ